MRYPSIAEWIDANGILNSCDSYGSPAVNPMSEHSTTEGTHPNHGVQIDRLVALHRHLRNYPTPLSP